MKCAPCGIDVAPPGKACPKCGKPPTAGTDLDSGYSYDILPDEPKKERESDAPSFELPPGPLPPPGALLGAPPGEEKDPLDKDPIRTQKDGPRGAAAVGASMLAGGNRPILYGAAAFLLLVILVIFLKPSKPELKGKLAIDQTYTVSPEKAQILNFEVRGKGKAEFTITATAHEGDVTFGLGRRSLKDPQTNPALKKCLEFVKTTSPGKPETLEGEVEAGTWSWIFLNESKKAVRVKVKAKIE